MHTQRCIYILDNLKNQETQWSAKEEEKREPQKSLNQEEFPRVENEICCHFSRKIKIELKIDHWIGLEGGYSVTFYPKAGNPEDNEAKEASYF